MLIRLFLLLSAVLTFTLAAQEAPPAPDAPPAQKAPVLIKAGTSSPCWVEVTVKPDAGRSVSIHDYILTADGSEYPCVAVALDTDTYSGTVWKLEQLDGSKNFRLLFPVPSKDASYRIKFKLLSTALPAAKLEFPAPASENPQESAPENP